MNRVKGVCEAMRLAGLKSLLLLVGVIVIAGAVAGCDNPLNPLKSSDKIQGLTYFDFAASQEHWDSDPEWDGLQITLSYSNEFGDALNFHDKPHKVRIEFYSEVPGATATDPATRTFLTSKTVEFSNSDDFIRIPIESYSGLLEIADPPKDISGCLQVSIFPPQEYPQRELVAPFQCGVAFFTAETEVSPP